MKLGAILRVMPLVVAVVWGSTLRGEVLIDHFLNATAVEIAGFTIVNPPGGTVALIENPGVALTGPIGGWRALTGTYGAPPGGFLNMQVAPGFMGGALLMTNQGITGVEKIEYGVNNLGPFDLNADLLTGIAGNPRFLLDWLTSNSVSTPLSIKINSNSGAQTFTLATSTPSVPGTQEVYFSSFPGIDWTDVDYIGITLNAKLNDNYQLGSISTIPEPSSLVLLGLCAAVAGGMRRRRQV